MSKRKRIVQAETADGQRLGEAIIEIVNNQLQEGNPPEVALTLARLIKGGESRESALRLIACAVSVEIFEIMKNQAPFDEARYVANLRRLPELPFDDEEG